MASSELQYPDGAGFFAPQDDQGMGRPVPDEITMAIATTLAAKGAEALVSGATNALTALVRLVRSRFSDGGRRAAALRDAQREPDDPRTRRALADALAGAMADDPEFARHLRSLWREASVELAADRGGVVNQFSGHAEKVVQARDIQGNISF
jgi:hypothetical protein